MATLIYELAPAGCRKSRMAEDGGGWYGSAGRCIAGGMAACAWILHELLLLHLVIISSLTLSSAACQP